MQLEVNIRGTGYPILCLHGHPGNKHSMAVFTDALAGYGKTIAPDLRGYGQSQTQQPFEMTAHLTDLDELLHRLEVQQCLVLGWSLGGILAMELALLQPQRVSGLILVATAARPVGDHPPITWQDNTLTAIASLVNRLAPGWQWNIDTLAKRSLYRYLIQQHTSAAYQRLAEEALPAFLQTSRLADRALSQALRRGYNRLTEVSTLSMPSLVLCGECDRHITAGSSQETAQYLPNSTLITYPNTAHLFPWEISAQVIADIEKWLLQNFSMLNRPGLQ